MLRKKLSLLFNLNLNKSNENCNLKLRNIQDYKIKLLMRLKRVKIEKERQFVESNKKLIECFKQKINTSITSIYSPIVEA